MTKVMILIPSTPSEEDKTRIHITRVVSKEQKEMVDAVVAKWGDGKRTAGDIALEMFYQAYAQLYQK